MTDMNKDLENKAAEAETLNDEELEAVSGGMAAFAGTDAPGAGLPGMGLPGVGPDGLKKGGPGIETIR